MGERLLKRCVGLLVAFVFCATAWGAQDRIEDRVRVRAKDWTVLIFLNGHNNLDQAGIFSEIDEAYAGTLIANKTTPRFDGATGMAIWFPTYFSASAMERYKALRFNKGTDWASTLEMLWALHLHARQDLRVRQP